MSFAGPPAVRLIAPITERPARIAISAPPVAVAAQHPVVLPVPITAILHHPSALVMIFLMRGIQRIVGIGMIIAPIESFVMLVGMFLSQPLMKALVLAASTHMLP